MGGIFVCFTVQKYDFLFWFVIVDKQNICDIKQLNWTDWERVLCVFCVIFVDIWGAGEKEA